MTEIKPFPMDNLRTIFPVTEESALPNASLALRENLTLSTRESKRTAIELGRTRSATSTLDHLPEHDESIHAILSGDFSLFDMLAAIIDLAAEPIERLHIVTLSMAHRNVDRLDQWANAGTIRDLSIIVSCYHAAADKAIFDHATEFCGRHGFRILPLRSHAKMLAVKAGNRRIICESSANLRSCRNIENAVLYDNAELYDWHTRWMDGLFAEGGAQ